MVVGERGKPSEDDGESGDSQLARDGDAHEQRTDQRQNREVRVVLEVVRHPRDLHRKHVVKPHHGEQGTAKDEHRDQRTATEDATLPEQEHRQRERREQQGPLPP